uniref:Uncharacterized protein n=1 Tax=Onchocerca volvulus TaxID=6282 RepID=A0A8R1XU58_ONCVO
MINNINSVSLRYKKYEQRKTMRNKVVFRFNEKTKKVHIIPITPNNLKFNKRKNQDNAIRILSSFNLQINNKTNKANIKILKFFVNISINRTDGRNNTNPSLMFIFLVLVSTHINSDTNMNWKVRIVDKWDMSLLINRGDIIRVKEEHSPDVVTLQANRSNYQ